MSCIKQEKIWGNTVLVAMFAVFKCSVIFSEINFLLIMSDIDVHIALSDQRQNKGK